MDRIKFGGGKGGGGEARWRSSCNCANICVTNSYAAVAVVLTSSSDFGCANHTTTETTSTWTPNSVGTNMPGDHNQGYGWTVVYYVRFTIDGCFFLGLNIGVGTILRAMKAARLITRSIYSIF